MRYIEDLASIEHKAVKVEKEISELRLHNFEEPLLSQTPIPTIGTEIFGDARTEDELYRMPGNEGDHIEDFMERRDKPIYRYRSKSGNEYYYTAEMYSETKEKVKRKWADHLSCVKSTSTEEDYEVYVMRFLEYISNGKAS